jgi:hypothetical protein
MKHDLMSGDAQRQKLFEALGQFLDDQGYSATIKVGPLVKELVTALWEASPTEAAALNNVELAQREIASLMADILDEAGVCPPEVDEVNVDEVDEEEAPHARTLH